MKKKQNLTFNDYTDLFQSIELPLVLHSELHLDFNTAYDTFPTDMIDHYLIELSGLDHDEYTEYIPLCRLQPYDDIIALVLWKAALMTYEYYLLTYDRRGQLIDKQVIAGQKSNGTEMITRIATIDSDTNIVMVEGQSHHNDRHEVPEYTEEYNFEITPSGYIASV